VNRRYLIIVVLIALLHPIVNFAEPQGTAFTYQGELKQGVDLAQGSFDFLFELYDVLNGGIPVVPAEELENVSVKDGVFTVELDYGTEVFDGTQLWIEVSVREGDSNGSYTALGPRQKLTATPYALNTINGAQTVAADRNFVGYTVAVLTGDYHWLVEAADLCRAEFGSAATIATTRHIRKAIDNGTFFFLPEEPFAVMSSIDLFIFENGTTAFDIPLQQLTNPGEKLHIRQETFSTESMTDGLRATCVN